PKAQRAQTPGMELEVATFRADVTPPVGEVLDCGFDPPVKTVEHPLLAKGVVLRNRGGVYVLCALDWGGLCNSAYDLFRQRIAQAVGTSPSRVAVQCLHQHTAPAVDSNAQRILDEVEGAPLHANAKFVEASAGRVADALHGLVWRRATHIGTGWASVDRVASSRRILQPDGTILARLSSTRDPEQQVAPEGKVDGYLRTVGFYEGEKPIVQMHYYATHPQSYYRDGRVTYDVPGLARERLEDESGVFQLYFTGCAGDVAFGKYNTGTPEDRAALAERLYDGMKRSTENVGLQGVGPISWRTAELRFHPREEAAFAGAVQFEALYDAKASDTKRIMAAMILAFLERTKSGKPFELSCLSIGQVKLLHLPGEPFVEYQLWAQRVRDADFVAVAGYGDCAMWYICTDRAYRNTGGYEQSWSFVRPSEGMIKAAMEQLLEGGD
ncbi:MAG: hypothetical protein O2954_10825, partial [bacterium]|nr:hypothetical protein [bacterium]